MDKERLMNYFDHNYLPKRDVLNRIPLDTSLEAFWQELVNRRRSKATMLPMHSQQGSPYWFVLTDNMITASEKIVEEAMQPYQYADPAFPEEAFYTSFLEGSQMSIGDAVEFMKKNDAPKDIHEQLLYNNRQAISFAMENAYRPITEELVCALAGILTAEMDNGGSAYRGTDTHLIPSMGDEQYTVPSSAAIPGMMRELCAYLADTSVHPLLKAAVAHAWFMVVRPFGEGNERLARLISAMILVQAQYLFFNEISLSALIAQDGFGYYDAVGNLLRADNGGDWTYLAEYYVVLLGKAIDEIYQRRLNQEAEMAKLSLEDTDEAVQAEKKKKKRQPAQDDNMVPQDGIEHPDEQVLMEKSEKILPAELAQGSSSSPLMRKENRSEPFREYSDRPETVEEALINEGFFLIGLPKMEASENAETINPEPLPYSVLRQRLEIMAARRSVICSEVGKRLLRFLTDGRYTFKREEITAGIVDDKKSSSNVITRLRNNQILVSVEHADGSVIYGLNVRHKYSFFT